MNDMTEAQHVPETVSLMELLETTVGPGPVWTHSSTDLNVNLLSFDGGQGVPAHINRDLDVLVVVVAGDAISGDSLRVLHPCRCDAPAPEARPMAPVIVPAQPLAATGRYLTECPECGSRVLVIRAGKLGGA